MVTDHTAVNQAGDGSRHELKVRRRTIQRAKSEGRREKNLAALKTLDRCALDKAYVDNEVAYHQQVIDALDNVLIPGPGTKN